MVFSYDYGGTQNIFSLFWEVSLLQGSSLIDLGYCMIKSPLAFATTGPGFEC